MDFVQNMPMPPMDNKLSIEEQIKMFVEKNSNISLNDLSNEQIFSLAKKIILGNDYHQLYKNTTKIHINLDKIMNFLCKDDIEFTRKLFLLITPYVKYDSHDFSWFENINDDLWIELLKKYSGNYEKMSAIIKNNKYLNDNPINIEKILDIMNLEDRFKFIDENTKNDDFVKFFKKYGNELKNINNLDLYKHIIDKVIMYGTDNDKMFLMDLMSIDMIKRYGYKNFEKNLKSYSENELIEKLIDKNDNDLFLKVKKYINQNDFRDASTAYLQIRKKDNFGENLYIYFLQQIPNAESAFQNFYVKNNDNYLKHLILYVSKYNHNNHSFLAQLVSDEKKELALLLFNSSKSTQNFKNLLILYNNGIVDDNINKMMENFKKLKKIKIDLNPDYQRFDLELLSDDIIKRYSLNFIADVLEYNLGDVLVENKDSTILVNLEKFLKDNNLYSKNIIYKILYDFSKYEKLLSNLYKSQVLLTEDEKNNFILYINQFSDKLAIDNKNDLMNLRDNIIKNSTDSIENCVNATDLKKVIKRWLFNDENDFILGYFQEKNQVYQMYENKIIDEFDLALLEIAKDIENITDANINEAKIKYKDVLNKNINLIGKMHQMWQKYNEYFQEMILTDNLSVSDIKSMPLFKKYNDKNIPCYELNGQPFQLLVHGLSSNSGHSATTLANELKTEPKFWNETDYISTISCSLISNFFCGTVQSDIALGFENLPPNSLVGMYKGDARASWDSFAYNPKMSKREYFSPKRLIKKTVEAEKGYNEVTLYRKNEKIAENRGKIQPDYIIAFGNITEQHLKYAEYFSVPIIKISKRQYEIQNEDEVKKYLTGNFNKFDLDDVNKILSLTEISESKSVELILKYIEKYKDNINDFDNFINQVKKMYVKYSLEDKQINEFNEKIDCLINKTTLEEDVHGYH